MLRHGIKSLLVTVCLLLVACLSSCGKSTQSDQQVYSYVLPDAFWSENYEKETLLTSRQEEGALYPSLRYTQGENGQLVCSLSADDNQAMKASLYDMGLLLPMADRLPQEFADLLQLIHKSEYDDTELPSQVTYWVDKQAYQSQFPIDLSFTPSNPLAPVSSMALYQIMSGVNPEQWHVRVVVRDGKTDEILDETEYDAKDYQ